VPSAIEGSQIIAPGEPQPSVLIVDTRYCRLFQCGVAHVVFVHQI